jgi:hypothetical protein
LSWYSARLLYEFVHDPPDPKPKPLFEESLIVFRATKSEDPIEKLNQLARASEDNYEAAAGNHVYYTFREVLEVQEIMDRKIADGTEVFYRFWRNPGVRALTHIRKTSIYDWWTDDAPDRDEPQPQPLRHGGQVSGRRERGADGVRQRSVLHDSRFGFDTSQTGRQDERRGR